MEMYIVASIVVVLIVILILMSIFRRKRHLLPARKAHYKLELSNALDMEPTLGYITVDRILEQILCELHGGGTLGENLKKYYSKHPRRDDLWRMHKVRNKLVHEGSVVIYIVQVKEFVGVVKSLIY